MERPAEGAHASQCADSNGHGEDYEKKLAGRGPDVAPRQFEGGWWLVAGGCSPVAGGWWLVAGGFATGQEACPT
jgi:hypothetical protein